jgi:hypothetical protein
MNSTAMSNSPLQLIKAHLSKAWGKLKTPKAPITQAEILRQSKVIERKIRMNAARRNKKRTIVTEQAYAAPVQSDMDRAWQTVVLVRGGILEPMLTVNDQAKALHVSPRTLHTMNHALQKIVAANLDEYPENEPRERLAAIVRLSEIGWGAAKAQAKASGGINGT